MDLSTQRQHRTALLIDADSLSGAYSERVERLLQSLNGPNIKVDVYAVKPGAAVPTGGVVKIKSLSEIGVGGAVSTVTDADLQAAAKAAGYVQVLFTKPA